MRTIDADKLKTTIDQYIGRHKLAPHDRIMFESFKNFIADAPTVELKEIYQEGHYDGFLEGYTKAINEERPQGEWIRYRDDPHQPEHIKCSNCGQYWSIADHDKTFDFCFKCGASMMKGDAE